MVSNRDLVRVWFALGAQSFGGGSATLTLIRRAVVEKYEWVEASDFDADWSLCQVVPGVNLIAVTILLGRRIAGIRGVVIGLAGLLLPSVLITVLLTALYVQIRTHPLVHSALTGVIPASVGLGIYTAVQIAKAPIKQSRTDGTGRLIIAVAAIVSSAAVVTIYHVPAPMVLIAVACIGIGIALYDSKKRRST